MTVIEGIGPKIAQLLHAGGIESYDQLAQSSVADIKDILQNGGPRYSVHDPASWPQQAEMARAGRWEELKSWQAELHGGK